MTVLERFWTVGLLVAKMRKFGDFQRAYVRLTGWASFDDWESSIGTFEDVLFKSFWCLARGTWKGLENVAL